MDALTSALSSPLGAVLFPLWWCLVCWVLGWLGGWRGLARRYRSDDAPPPGATLASGRLGLVQYRNCLRVGGSAEGLHLSVPFLFRPGHPPLLVPWAEVDDAGERRFLWVTHRVLRLGPGRRRLRLYAGTWAHVAAQRALAEPVS